MTRFVLTPGLDRPDMIHAEPWDPERCRVDDPEILSEEIDEPTARVLLTAGEAIACRRCALKDESTPGDIAVLYPIELPDDAPEDAEGIG